MRCFECGFGERMDYEKRYDGTTDKRDTQYTLIQGEKMNCEVQLMFMKNLPCCRLVPYKGQSIQILKQLTGIFQKGHLFKEIS